jgi:hypothetical protein
VHDALGLKRASLQDELLSSQETVRRRRKGAGRGADGAAAVGGQDAGAQSRDWQGLEQICAEVRDLKEQVGWIDCIYMLFIGIKYAV